MAYETDNNNHAGPKKGCSSYCGRRADAKACSKVGRRKDDRKAIQEQERED